jgi:hypothetical protein
MRICWSDSLFSQVVLTVLLGLLELKDFMLVFFCSGMLATGVLCLWLLLLNGCYLMQCWFVGDFAVISAGLLLIVLFLKGLLRLALVAVVADLVVGCLIGLLLITFLDAGV